MVDPDLLKMLICPNCHGQVEYVEADAQIVCQGTCKYRYPVVDDIPHMLVDEAVKP